MRRDRILQFFETIWPFYELLNHVITMGLDILWRRAVVRIVKSTSSERWLDVCCGTGEMTRQLIRAAMPSTKIVGIDFSMSMIREAANRDGGITTYVVCDVRQLPFVDCSFNLVTMAFAARNLLSAPSGLVDAIREIVRVLVKSGVYINLETTRPASKPAGQLITAYGRVLLEIIGRSIPRSREAYLYLYHSYRSFYTTAQLATFLLRLGFTRIIVHRLTGGLAAIHIARR